MVTHYYALTPTTCLCVSSPQVWNSVKVLIICDLWFLSHTILQNTVSYISCTISMYCSMLYFYCFGPNVVMRDGGSKTLFDIWLSLLAAHSTARITNIHIFHICRLQIDQYIYICIVIIIIDAYHISLLDYLTSFSFIPSQLIHISLFPLMIER